VVHHYGKPGREETAGVYRTRGASSIRDWADTLLGFSRKKGDTILRTLTFDKVRNGPEPKPITLERDKETFLHSLVDEVEICPPGRVRAILAQLGGRVESQEKLLQAIVSETECSIRRARHFIKQAVSHGSITCDQHPTDSRKQVFETKIDSIDFTSPKRF
jgi:hypothetical protein